MALRNILFGILIPVLLLWNRGPSLARSLLVTMAAAAIPAIQRRGIGKRLVEVALKALKEQGINKVNLVAFARNEKGNTFWEKMGFTQRPDLIYRNRTLTDMVRIDT